MPPPTTTRSRKQANRVTNTQAADRILGDWAHELRMRLDEIKGKTSK